MNSITFPKDEIQAGNPIKLGAPPFLLSKNNRWIIVDENLRFFHSIHLEEQEEKGDSLEMVFPNSGTYHVYIPYLNDQGKDQVIHERVQVGGGEAFSPEIHEEKMVAEISGFTVNLENGKDIKTLRNQGLEFTIFKDGVKVNEDDLEPNPRIFAQLTMIRMEDKEWIHLHPGKDQFSTVYAEAFLEKPGMYRIWLEFNLTSEVYVADFTIIAENER